jgi:rfaE bifunctional protein kinase chain/domain/rfaE bifunctional protein nucleotidyltransferase chain/domain
MRREGKTVVHCHGCFDIVHPGHISHLQEARSLGGGGGGSGGGGNAVLVVSVSSDANVNKGVARPLIHDDLRAQSLAALECVDAVHINSTPTAVELLEALKPDIYVKGREYERSADPRFLAEQSAVTTHGGRVAFTSGQIVYSSTALIAQLTETDPFETEKLSRLLARYDITPASLSASIRAFEGKRVVVIGDYILDRYHFCDATSVASEAPMMSLRLLARSDYDGGAAIIARHAASLGAHTTLITSLTDAPESHDLIARLAGQNITTTPLTNRRDLVTKHRYLCETTKVLKLDEGSLAPLDSASIETLTRLVQTATEGGVDAIILADFGLGLLTPSALQAILPICRANSHILAADVSGPRSSLRLFKHADLLTPTERELRHALADPASGLNAVAWNLLHETQAKNLIVTLGRQGAIAFDRAPGESPDGRLRSEHIPALTKHALDPLGCGDALLTTATLSLSAQANLHQALYLGSLAASLQATRLGNTPLTPEDLLTKLPRTNPTPHLQAA